MNRIDSLNEFIQKNPEDIFLHYALAMEFISLNDLDKAASKLEWIRNTKSDYLPLYYQLAHVYESLNRNDEAIDVYEYGIELALKTGDLKTAGELRSALEELQF